MGSSALERAASRREVTLLWWAAASDGSDVGVPVIDPTKDESYGGRKIQSRTIAQGLREAGLDGAGVLNRVAIALWESDAFEEAYYVNRAADGSVASIDRGLFQINSKAHPDLSDEHAYYWRTAAAYAAKLGLTAWVAWNRYLAPAAMAALKAKADAGDTVAAENYQKALDTWREAILGYANERCFAMHVGLLRKV